MSLAEREDLAWHDLDQHGANGMLQIAHTLGDNGPHMIADHVGQSWNDDGPGVAADWRQAGLQLLDVAGGRKVQLGRQLPAIGQSSSPETSHIRIS